MSVSVVIPAYKGTPYIRETLDSIFSQTHTKFELIICNDSQEDEEKLQEILSEYPQEQIKFYQNEKNLGYPLNLKKCVEKSTGDILFLMGQDDILLDPKVFEKALEIFEKHPRIGAITRPYYWFEEKVTQPIRQVPKYHKRIINPQEATSTDLKAVLETLGQLSGLVYRKKLITHPFNENVFTAHIYPFLSIMKTNYIYFWEDFMVAVRTSSSQTRSKASIYNPSPTKTWVEMFKTVFPEKEFTHIRRIGIDHITQNYIGLVQIKNYGRFKDLIIDIYYLIKHRPKNLLSPSFWLIGLGVLLIPKVFLRSLVDWYKNVLNKSRLKNLLHEN
ncbi:glycosyltransferase [candidate division WWE3 bacterium]|nr:glycosyltransferase [candidate division WWE3 bacterium]